MTSAPRSARAVVMAAGPSIEHSTMRTPASGWALTMAGESSGSTISATMLQRSGGRRDGSHMLNAITDVDAYVRTREGWHALAERVLAPVLHRATGHIGLRVDDGITTPPFGPDERRVRAWVGNLEERTATAGRTTSLTTLGAAA